MKFNIYDFNDNITVADTKDKDIDRIEVEVISGNEVVFIEYKDGSFEKIDSCKDRAADLYNGGYALSGDKLVEWLNFKVRKGEVDIPYIRLDEFGGCED